MAWDNNLKERALKAVRQNKSTIETKPSNSNSRDQENVSAQQSDGKRRGRDPELAREMETFDLLAYIQDEAGEPGNDMGGYIMFHNCPICGHHEDLAYYPYANGEHEPNTFYCYHSNKGGDAISYLMERGMTFPEALGKVAPNYAAKKDAEFRANNSDAQDGNDKANSGNPDYWKNNPHLEPKFNKDGKIVSYLQPTVPALLWWMERNSGLKGVRLETMSQQITIDNGLPWDKDAKIWKPVDDNYLFSCMQNAYKYKGVSILRNDKNLGPAFNIYCSLHKYDRLIETFESLPAWDGACRKDSILIDFLGAEDTEYTRAVTSLLLRAALERTYHPGAKFDYMVVLQGPQGIGKSTVISRLALRPEFFVDDVKNIGTKEAQEQIQGRLFVEFAELASLKGKSVETLKSFITSRVDSYRVPYDKRSVQLARRCVLLGTTNQHEYLTDPTGNRRFLPVECHGDGCLDLFADDIGDYFEQVWAEALVDYRNSPGKKLVLPANLKGDVEEIRERATTEDPWIGLIGSWLDKQPIGKLVCTTQVIEKALEIDKAHIVKNDNMHCSRIIRDNFPEWEKLKNRKIEGYGVQRAFRKVKEHGALFGV